MRSSILLVLLVAVAATSGCSDAETPLSRAQRVVTRVFEGAPLPMLGEQVPADPELARELALVPIAIRASKSIVMEENPPGAGDQRCVHGKLVGAPGEPTLAMILAGDRVVHASIERRCTCTTTCSFVARAP